MDAGIVLLVVFLVGFGALSAVVLCAVLLARRVALAGRRQVRTLALRASSAGIGQRADVAQMRLALANEVRAARRAVDVARVSDWPLGDSPSLVGRLERAAEQVDCRLEVLAGDRGVEVPELWAAAREEAQTLCRAAAALRAALVRRASDEHQFEVGRVSAECLLEARALRLT